MSILEYRLIILKKSKADMSLANINTVKSRVLMRATYQNFFLSKGHSTYGSKISFINNLKKPACAVKQEVLELATLRYLNMKFKLKLRSMNLDKIVRKRDFLKIINL